MPRWFAFVDMGDPSPGALAVMTGLERLLDDIEPAHMDPARSWIKSRGHGWPPPDLVPPDFPASAVPDWVDCELGIRIGHDTEPEANITIGVGPQHAVVGSLGGRMTVRAPDDPADQAWIYLVVENARDALCAEYVWERSFRGGKCVRSELSYVGVDEDGSVVHHVTQGFHTRTAWLPFLRADRVERRVVTYGLRTQH